MTARTDVRLRPSDVRTSHQVLALFRTHTGHSPRIKPYEVIVSAQLLDGGVGHLAITTYRFTERSRDVLLHARGTRIVSVNSDGLITQDVIWDDTFVPTIEVLFKRATLPERQERWEWEDLCAAPGDNSRFGARDSREYRESVASLESSTIDELTDLFYAAQEAKRAAAHHTTSQSDTYAAATPRWEH